MLIIVNKNSNGGKGYSKWAKVKAALDARGMKYELQETSSEEEAQRAAESAIQSGTDTLIAAGGDGSVNHTLNQIMDPRTDRPRGHVALGAIGLGSSNDFHKPMSPKNPKRWIEGVPVGLDETQGSLVDVGKAVMTDASGKVSTRYFCLNASLGFVAEGNAFFNTQDPTLLWLKRRNVEVAILYTAFVNLRRFKPVELTLKVDDGAEEEISTTSLGILKKVHFAGGMRYDTPVTASDGHFDVTLWGAKSRGQLVKTMAGLYSGKFSGRMGNRTLRARKIEFKARAPIAFELDGEVHQVVSARIEVIPQAIKVCG